MRPSTPFFTPDLAVGFGNNSPDDPHWIVRERGTTSWLIEVTVGGQGRIELPHGPLLVGEGWVIVFRPEAPQNYGMDPERQAWRHYWAWFTPPASWLNRLDWPALGPGVLGFAFPEGDPRRRIEALWESILDAWRSPYDSSEDLTLNLIEQFLIRCDIHNPRNPMARLDERIRRAMELIARSYMEPLSVEDIADAVHLSPSRLAHLFRQETGMTPMGYLEQVRMERARELLLMTSFPISRISEATGFANPFYFSRIFRRHNEMPPSEYRRRVR